MEHRSIDPWKWQDRFGFHQGREITGANRTLFLAGQTSVDADGRPIFNNDMGAQVGQAIDNIETVLAAGDMTLENVVRITMYTTDIDRFLAESAALSRLNEAGSQYTSTLIGVTRLAMSDLLVELEATAVA